MMRLDMARFPPRRVGPKVSSSRAPVFHPVYLAGEIPDAENLAQSISYKCRWIKMCAHLKGPWWMRTRNAAVWKSFHSIVSELVRGANELDARPAVRSKTCSSGQLRPSAIWETWSGILRTGPSAPQGSNYGTAPNAKIATLGW